MADNNQKPGQGHQGGKDQQGQERKDDQSPGQQRQNPDQDQQQR